MASLLFNLLRSYVTSISKFFISQIPNWYFLVTIHISFPLFIVESSITSTLGLAGTDHRACVGVPMEYDILCYEVSPAFINILGIARYQSWRKHCFKSDLPSWGPCPFVDDMFLDLSSQAGPFLEDNGWGEESLRTQVYLNPSSHKGNDAAVSAWLRSGRPLCYSHRLPQKLCLLLSFRETSLFLSVKISLSCVWCCHTFKNF